MSCAKDNVFLSRIKRQVRIFFEVPLKRPIPLLILAAIVLCGSLYIEKRWRPVRGLSGALELARVEKKGGAPTPLEERHPVVHGRLVAHAGGGIDGHAYVNSLDAIEENYRRGHRAFEVDLAFTSDGVLVLQHDWGGAVGNQVPTLAEFQATRIYGRYKPTTWKLVTGFLQTHGDAVIITDTKYNNEEVLGHIKRATPEVCGQVIPQIYSFSEYAMVKSLGFSPMILTLYKQRYWNQSVVAFAASHDVSVTMPWSPQNFTLAEQLADSGVEVFFHSVNDSAVLGAHPRWKFYTDFIDPALDKPR
jgi:glycerophosphoryl diester phosphodiesterase